MRYIAERQARVQPFCRRHFSIRGSLRLHRKALGLDLLRAPINLLLVIPTVLMMALAAVLTRAGAHKSAQWLNQRSLFLETDVSREITWLIYTELLEIPVQQCGRRSDRDAIAEAIAAEPEVTEAIDQLTELARNSATQPALREDLEQVLRTYTGARNAVADLGNTVLMLSAGAVTFSKLTPGALSLGPAVAALVAQQVAISSFPLGVGFGSLWYGLFPSTPSLALMIGATTLLMMLAASIAALSGVLLDPIQSGLGMHQRRLRRLIDRLARQLTGAEHGAYHVREHYAARLVDLFELSAMMLR